jgi:hypothetical protein
MVAAWTFSLTVIGSLAAVASAASQTPSTVAICVNPSSGAVKIALSGEQCPPKQQRIEIPVAEQTTGTGALRVADQNGDIGPYENGSVVVNTATGAVAIPVNQNGLDPTTQTVWYETTDCTGTPYLQAPTTALIQSCVKVSANTCAYPTPGGPTTTLRAYSVGLGTACTVWPPVGFPPSPPTVVSPLNLLDVTQLGWVPPLRVTWQ